LRDKDRISPKRWAYLAGLVDGDGSFCIRSVDGTGYQFTMYVYNSHRPLMKWLVRVFGSTWRKLPTEGNRKQKYCWYTSNKDIVRNLVPYLILKQKQANLSHQFLTMAFERNPQGREDLMLSLQTANQEFVPVSKKAVEEAAQSVEPTKLDWAYLAGLFDAEGTFAIQKRKKLGNGSYTSYAKISNTDNTIFPWIMSRFGGTLAINKREDRNEGAWSLSEARGLKARKQREIKLLAMLPYLIVKRERAILLLEWIRNNHLYTKQQKLDCFEKMTKLNFRGISPEANIPRPLEKEDMIESDPDSDAGGDPTVMLES